METWGWIICQVGMEPWVGIAGPLLAGKLVLARMDNCAAVAYADYGAGRVSTLTALARKIKGREVAMGCTVAALRIAGRDYSVADALSRFSISVRGLGGVGMR